MNNDGALATGVNGDEMFANNAQDGITKEAERKEQEAQLAIIPTAEDELKGIDDDLAKLNTLSDFFLALDVPPTNMSQEDIRIELEARRRYMDRLLARRSVLITILGDLNRPTEQYRWLPPAFTIPVRVESVERPRGWAAIRAGLRDIFGRAPM